MGEDGVKGMKIQKTRNSHCGVKKKTGEWWEEKKSGKEGNGRKKGGRNEGKEAIQF